MSDLQNFKDAMSQFATGVNVAITKKESTNSYIGITINSFASLSLEPQLVLFNLKKTSFCYQDFLDSESFAFNILSSSQKELSQAFTKAVPLGFWDNASITKKHKFPCFKESLCYVECKKYNEVDGGDHSIIIGKVTYSELISKKSKPLLYFNRNYNTTKNEFI